MVSILTKIAQLKGHTFMGIEIGRLLLSLVITVIIILLSGLLSKFFTGLIKKLLKRTDEGVLEKFNRSFATCLRLFFIAIAFWIGFELLGMESLFLIVNKLVRLFIVFLAVWGLYRGIDIIVFFFKEYLSRTDSDMDNHLGQFMGQVLKFLLISTGIVMFIHEMGYDVTTIIASLGVGGLAVALAGKDFVANIFGFFTIFMDRSFILGDWISTPDVEGTVEYFGMRSTKIRTVNDTLVTIPNSVIASKKIDNFSKMEKRQMTFNLGLTHDSPVEKIEKFCERIRILLTGNTNVNNETIYVYLKNLGENSIDVSVTFYTNRADFREYMETQHNLKITIMKMMEEMEMKLAFPSRSIYVEKTDIEETKLPDELKK